jgi:hypothetical protein
MRRRIDSFGLLTPIFGGRIIGDRYDNDGRERNMSDQASYGGVRVSIMDSPGDDGAMVVYIDTDFEPNGSDGSGLRVYINDDITYEGVSVGEVDWTELNAE